ncbi:phage integrase N-terminal SAM-like domain-containing protein [Kaistella anthropi]|nr:phage integrase N-terminal SAM-like domain-containing protein [Kaistella anthropi]
MATKKISGGFKNTNKFLNRASSEVNGFAELLQRFERNISILGRSRRTFENYSRHVAALALHFGKAPTELDPEDIKDYLFELQMRSKTPSQSYFKHTVYGLRFLLKTEGLPYSYLHLPAIPKVKKLPTILSREEIWRMLQSAELLKHKLLIGLIYGCGLRCMEVRNIKLHTQNAAQ